MNGPVPPDPFFLPEVLNTNNTPSNYNGGLSFRDTSAKTLRANQAASGYSACIVLVIAGQSMDEDSAPTNQTPTNASNVHNFNPFDGAVYAGLDPLLGATGLDTSHLAHPYTRLADKLINAGATCIVLVPIAVGGTLIAQWASGGMYYPRLKNTINRLNARGFTTQYVLWGQGPSDCAAGTSQVNYVASGNALFSDLQASVAKIFVAEQSFTSAIPGTCSAIQNAQTVASPSGLINHSASPPIWAGPNSDSLTGANRQADTQHWSDTGSDAYAGLWQTALHASGAPF